MAKLWFGDSFGKKRVIAECENFREANVAIDKFIADANAKRTDGRPFKRYYTRIWNEDGHSVFDIGSHTEFFYFGIPYPEDDCG